MISYTYQAKFCRTTPVYCSVKHDCLVAGVVQVVTMTVLSTSYNTLACVNNIGVQLSVELNGDEFSVTLQFGRPPRCSRGNALFYAA